MNANDENTQFDNRWHLYNSFKNPNSVGINAISAWDMNGKGSLKGSPRVRVVILDTGVDYKHPSLEANVEKSLARDFDHCTEEVKEGKDIYDRRNRIYNKFNAHGTACAGVVAAIDRSKDVPDYNLSAKDHAKYEREKMIVGVAPGCKIIPVRISTNYETESLVNAIKYAEKVGHVILLPRIMPEREDVKNAIETVAKSVPVVCASGNNGTKGLNFPATVEGVIAVGACNEKGYRSTYSQYGDDLTVVAPSNDASLESREIVRLDKEKVKRSVKKKEDQKELVSIIDQVKTLQADRGQGAQAKHPRIIFSFPKKDPAQQFKDKCTKYEMEHLGKLSIATTDNRGSHGYNSDPEGDYCEATGNPGFGGTSAAAAQVAGVVALMLSVPGCLKIKKNAVPGVGKQWESKLKADRIKQLLCLSASYKFLKEAKDKNAKTEFGSGLINALKAVMKSRPSVNAYTSIRVQHSDLGGNNRDSKRSNIPRSHISMRMVYSYSITYYQDYRS